MIESDLKTPEALACKNLNTLAQALRRKRRAAGAVQCASVEPKFKVDRESQLPTEMALYESQEANVLVEEFMLLANTSVARFILKTFPQFAFLRRHPEPKEDKLQQLAMAAKLSGFHIDTSTSMSLADSLDAAQVPGFPFYNKLLRILTAQCMNEATYFSSGTLPPQVSCAPSQAFPRIHHHSCSPIHPSFNCFFFVRLFVCSSFPPPSPAEISPLVPGVGCLHSLHFTDPPLR